MAATETYPPLPAAMAGVPDPAPPRRGESPPSVGRALRRYWWVVVLASLCAVGAAFAVVRAEPERFEATSKVLLAPSRPVDTVLNLNPARSLDPERDINTSVDLVEVNEVAAGVRAKLRLADSVDDLLAQVDAATVGNSNIIAIAAQDANPVRAAEIANAFADEYLAFRLSAARVPYDAAIARARADLAAFPARPGPAQRAQKASLRDRIVQLRTAAALQSSGAQVVDRATPPTATATPPLLLILGVALVAGAMIGIVAAVGLDRLRPPRRRRA
jgi:uncharacterized protein involved in exopolysaccharide biosynthesis